MRVLLVVLLTACASSISATTNDAEKEDSDATQISIDVTDATTADTADAAHPVDEGVDGTCLRRPIPCSQGDTCDEVCGGQCVGWQYLVSVTRIARDYVCIRSSTRFPAQCSPNIVGSSFCGVDEVCNQFIGPDGMIVQGTATKCVDAAMCVEYAQRFDREHPEALARQACWYSDMTIARTAVRAPALCLRAGLQTCGVGCAPCAAGTVCTWSSERYPTGFCMPIRPQDNPFQHATCAAPNTVWPCGAGQACLQPLRGTVDGFEDRRRGGLCITTEDCRAAAAALPDGYRCTYRPW
jgi:hypothetical protein